MLFIRLNLFIMINHTKRFLNKLIEQSFSLNVKNFYILVHVHITPRNSCYLQMPKTQKLGRLQVVFSGHVCVIAL